MVRFCVGAVVAVLLSAMACAGGPQPVQPSPYTIDLQKLLDNSQTYNDTDVTTQGVMRQTRTASPVIEILPIGAHPGAKGATVDLNQMGDSDREEVIAHCGNKIVTVTGHWNAKSATLENASNVSC